MKMRRENTNKSGEKKAREKGCEPLKHFCSLVWGGGVGWNLKVGVRGGSWVRIGKGKGPEEPGIPFPTVGAMARDALRGPEYNSRKNKETYFEKKLFEISFLEGGVGGM